MATDTEVIRGMMCKQVSDRGCSSEFWIDKNFVGVYWESGNWPGGDMQDKFDFWSVCKYYEQNGQSRYRQGVLTFSSDCGSQFHDIHIRQDISDADWLEYQTFFRRDILSQTRIVSRIPVLVHRSTDLLERWKSEWPVVNLENKIKDAQEELAYAKEKQFQASVIERRQKELDDLVSERAKLLTSVLETKETKVDSKTLESKETKTETKKRKSTDSSQEAEPEAKKAKTENKVHEPKSGIVSTAMSGISKMFNLVVDNVTF